MNQFVRVKAYIYYIDYMAIIDRNQFTEMAVTN